MNILRSITNIYKGENSRAIHASILALTGIAGIAFVNISSLFLGHSIYSVFSEPKEIEAIIFSILGIMIFIFFNGYRYKYANNIFKNENNQLPSVSMDCFAIFAKIFPLIVIWASYFLLFYIIVGAVIGLNTLTNTIIGLIMFIIAPFIHCVFIIYSKNFKYEKYLFNPLLVFKIMKKTFLKIILWILQFAILFMLITLCLKYIFKIIYLPQTRFGQLCLTLAITCLSGYFQEIIHLTYVQGIVNILKQNYIK